jgi:hypothetical protein
VRLLPLLGLLAACEKSTPKPATVGNELKPAPGDWQCFVRDPNEPDLPQGNVTHTRQRLIDGRLEVESVNVQLGNGGATRLVFRPTGDHGSRPTLEAKLGGVTVTAKLLAPDASHWSLSYRDPESKLEFAEEDTLAGGVLTVISTDSSDSGPVKTAVKYVPASCDVVVAELAKYPG